MTLRIKEAREKKGFSQKVCADEVGVTLRAWQNYEQGEREPKYEILCKIADLLGVTVDYLLGREEENPFSSFKPIDNDEFIRLYSALPEPVKEAFVGVMAQLAQAQKSKSKKIPPKADSAPQLFIAASDGNPVTKMDKGVIDRLKSAKPIDDDF